MVNSNFKTSDFGDYVLFSTIANKYIYMPLPYNYESTYKIDFTKVISIPIK